MSWILKLYETFENCSNIVGGQTGAVPLMPVFHVPQNAQIEIIIDGEGNFKRANVITNNQSTIIPCTEASGGRAGTKPACHPLCDKLQYVAGDFTEHGGEVTSGFAKDPTKPFNEFISLLSDWCSSEEFAHPKAKAVLEYVKKKSLIKDLLKQRVLYAGPDGKLLRKWHHQEIAMPEIFKQLKGNSWQADALVVWSVEIAGEPSDHVWTDTSLSDSWVKYYLNRKTGTDLCYVTGELLPRAEQHPSRIRHNADRAKLISSPSDPNSFFTFRGRFLDSDQACSVGCDVTQKAHNALRWLIARQGYKKDGQAIVAWAISGAKIPDPLSDTLALFQDSDARSGISSPYSTAQNLAKSLAGLIAGYRANFQDMNATDIAVLSLDSATPGRMAVTYYRELSGSEFLNRIFDWHNSCSWRQDYGRDFRTKEDKYFVGAPAPGEIAWAAYGQKIGTTSRKTDDKLLKATVERILPCIVDGEKIPNDLVDSAVRQVSNPQRFEPWEWTKALGIACAIYKHRHRERRYDMSLETDRHTRDYLYGRLLALADVIERWALKESGEKRETNSTRMMQRFASHPCSTWKTIELSLIPSKARLGARASKHYKLMDEIVAAFETEDFTSDRALTGEFLLGYHCQREALRYKEPSPSE